MIALDRIKGIYLASGILVGLAIGYAVILPGGPRAPSNSTCAHSADVFRCVRYVSNYDGDTIRVEIPGVHRLLGEEISVRISGIDTPELRARLPCEEQRAREARSLVHETLSRAKQIELHNVGRDKYFRILADVRADGKSVGQDLLSAGLAYVYEGKTKRKVNWCELARSQGKRK